MSIYTVAQIQGISEQVPPDTATDRSVGEEPQRLFRDAFRIIYLLEGHPKFGPRFRPLFAAHAAGRLRFAVTTIAIAEVLTGPLQAADDALARRYRAILESWQPIDLDV